MRCSGIWARTIHTSLGHESDLFYIRWSNSRPPAAANQPACTVRGVLPPAAIAYTPIIFSPFSQLLPSSAAKYCLINRIGGDARLQLEMQFCRWSCMPAAGDAILLAKLPAADAPSRQLRKHIYNQLESRHLSCWSAAVLLYHTSGSPCPLHIRLQSIKGCPPSAAPHRCAAASRLRMHLRFDPSPRLPVKPVCRESCAPLQGGMAIRPGSLARLPEVLIAVSRLAPFSNLRPPYRQTTKPPRRLPFARPHRHASAFTAMLLLSQLCTRFRYTSV